MIRSCFAGPGRICLLSMLPLRGAVDVALDPPAAVMARNETRPFSAKVSGTDHSAITWSATGGDVSPLGVYTAPSADGCFVVTATSVSDPGSQASAKVVVTVDGNAEIGGAFSSNHGNAWVVQNGKALTGRWERSDAPGPAAQLYGTVAGTLASGEWITPDGGACGMFQLTFAEDGDSFHGEFFAYGDTTPCSDWKGLRKLREVPEAMAGFEPARPAPVEAKREEPRAASVASSRASTPRAGRAGSGGPVPASPGGAGERKTPAGFAPVLRAGDGPVLCQAGLRVVPDPLAGPGGRVVVDLLIEGVAMAVWERVAEEPRTVSVSLVPRLAVVTTGQKVKFQPEVKGSGHTAVLWKMIRPDDGEARLGGDGEFTALRPGTYRIVATSRADPRARDSAEIEVNSRVIDRGLAPRCPGKGIALADGRLLLVGNGGIGRVPVSSATLFDPRKGSYLPVGPMREARQRSMGLAGLADGGVILSGGFDRMPEWTSRWAWHDGGLTIPNYFETFHPGTHRFEGHSVHLDLPAERLRGRRRDPLLRIMSGPALKASEHLYIIGALPDFRHTETVGRMDRAGTSTGFPGGLGLPVTPPRTVRDAYPVETFLIERSDGRYRLIANNDCFGYWYDRDSFWTHSPDPFRGISGKPPETTYPPNYHLLSNGDLIVLGQWRQYDRNYKRIDARLPREVVRTACAYNVHTRTWRTLWTGPRHSRMEPAIVELPKGTALITGGREQRAASRDAAGKPSEVPVAEAECYDLKTGRFNRTGVMNQPRCRHASLVLPGGKVLVAGGVGRPEGIDVPVTGIEIHDPGTGAFELVEHLDSGIESPESILNKDGRVFLMGRPSGAMAPVLLEWAPIQIMLVSRNIDTSDMHGWQKPLKYFEHAGWAIEAEGKSFLVQSGPDDTNRNKASLDPYEQGHSLHQFSETRNSRGETIIFKVYIREKYRLPQQIVSYENLEGVVQKWNEMYIPYKPLPGPNSNTFAFWFGIQLGLELSTLSGFDPLHPLPGWSYPKPHEIPK